MKTLELSLSEWVEVFWKGSSNHGWSYADCERLAKIMYSAVEKDAPE